MNIAGVKQVKTDNSLQSDSTNRLPHFGQKSEEIIKQESSVAQI